MQWKSTKFNIHHIITNKEQGTLGIKNGPVSKFIEISKEAQQQFTYFKTVNFFQI